MDLTGDRIYLVLVFHTIQNKLYLILSVIQVVLLFHKLQVVPAQLGGEKVLSSGGVDISLVSIRIVVIIFVQGYGLGADLIGLHDQANRFRDIAEELVVGVGGAALQLQDNIPLLAGYGGVEIAAGVYLFHQVSRNRGAGLALIVGAGGQHRLAVSIAAGESHHVARGVVVHLDLRVDAEQEGAHSARLPLPGEGSGCSGRSEIRAAGCGSACSAGGQGQSQSGGQSQTGQISQSVLFHDVHLL